jgi:hypothetical protein
MKTLLITFLCLVSLRGIAQNTGDTELDKQLATISTNAKADWTAFKNDVAKTYTTTVAKIDKLIALGMSGGDIIMAHEVASVAKKPVDDVVESYKKNKSKGWGAIAKEMGIKPGSDAFHKLKGNCKSKAEKGKSKGNSGAKGKSGSKGSSKAKGKGK